MQAIYKITNTITGMYYIGSTVDVERRQADHFNDLRRGTHRNSKMQNSYNKHGKDSFIFEIIRELPDWYESINRYRVEQVYLNSLDKNKVYNLCFIAEGGGSDVRAIPIYLLNLKGDIIKPFDSIQDCSRYLECNRQISTIGLNKDSILYKKYRIVTPEFYFNNIDKILSWKKETATDRDKRISQEIKNNRIVVVTLDGRDYEFDNNIKASEFLGISAERVRQILVSGKSKKFNIRFKSV